MTASRTLIISNLLGFREGSIPFTFLGCPIFKGKPKRVQFQAIVDKIKVKMATLKGSLLSIMGRVQLIKTIINGILVFSFHVYQQPRRFLKTLDIWIKFFTWRGYITTWKVCTVSWKQLCMPWEEGGLELRSTCDINASLLLGLSWKCYAHALNGRFFLEIDFLLPINLTTATSNLLFGLGSENIWTLLLGTQFGLLVVGRTSICEMITGWAIHCCRY